MKIIFLKFSLPHCKGERKSEGGKGWGGGRGGRGL